jgi:hypothetical protein
MPRDPDGFTDEPERPRRYEDEDYARREDELDFRRDDVHVPNYLVQSILVTVLCCWAFGIPAIIYAAQVDGKVREGDVEGARRASNLAKVWCWVSFAVGLILVPIFVALQIAAESIK